MKQYKFLQLILSMGLIVVAMLLYQTWEKEHPVSIAPQVLTDNVVNTDLPTVPLEEKILDKNDDLAGLDQKRLITVDTDVLHLEIDTRGGDILQLSFPRYTESKQSLEGLHLFDSTAARYYIAQSGLMGEQTPDTRQDRAQYTVSQKTHTLSKEADTLLVDLTWKSDKGVSVVKRFSFKRGSYLFSIQYLIDNQSSAPFSGRLYGRFKRQREEEQSRLFGAQTFTGAAMYTPERPYQKWTFKEIAKKPFQKEIRDGWAAFVEHYFLGAWIPEAGKSYFYQTESLGQDKFGVGFVAPSTRVMPGEKATIGTELYAGPQLTEVLHKLRPGLELTVDYGLLWPICQPIFWILKTINQWVHNWGWSIIFTTLLIKLLFYKLSATSYRSMNKMKKLQPKMTALKERYGDDKQKMGQAVMELYRQEKINPLGGCLPVIVQIPVFIALYSVLLGSVELRHSPFMGWIQDLSAKDPYFVLPILMGMTMFVQQKLSPAPPDPMQAKVMMFMPIVFTVLFLQFPAGLVLYWLISNLLSILQQWVITKRHK